MASSILTWDNTNVLANPNVSRQRVSKRVKTVGGPFLITGFTPANDLPKSVNTVDADVTANKVYEFKVEAICTFGGPTANDNGIIEGIAFGCIVPSFTQTINTGQVVVNLIDTDITKVRFILRKLSDNSLVANQTVSRVGDSVTANFSGLAPNTGYWVEYDLYAMVNGIEVSYEVQNPEAELCGHDTTYNFTTNSSPSLIWIPLMKVCERANLFGVLKTITGVASPLNTWYDQVTGRMYVADIDAPGGNVYWFNPATATSAADMVYSTVVQQDELYSNYIDAENRKIYFVGRNSGGLLVYDIDTDTASVVAFGTDGVAFNRTDLFVLGDRIYCNDELAFEIIIDRASLTVTNTIDISTIPHPEYFNAGPRILIRIGDEIWVVSSNGDGDGPGVYNLTLDTFIGEVALPGAAVFSFGNYWQDQFFDATSGLVYVMDVGSGKQYRVNPATKLVVDERTLFNDGNKTNVGFTWFINPVNNALIGAAYFSNSSADATPVKRMYIEDRAAFGNYKDMFTNFFIQRPPAQVLGTNQFVGAFTGQPSYGGDPDWAIDGILTVLDSSISGDNTGRGLVITLQEVDANNGNAPTGNIKDNTPSDVDYVAPIDPDPDCPVTFTTICPAAFKTTFDAGALDFEFSVVPSTRNNPAILKVRATAYNLTGATIEGVPVIFNGPFANNYFKGTVTGLGGTNYTIVVEYLGAADAVLQVCLL